MSTSSGLAVVDLDGHVFEPDWLWEEHLDPAFMDRRPRLVHDERGTTRYMFDGRIVPPGTGVGAWVPEGIQEASTQRDGATDPKARLVDMDTEGIDVAVLYGAASLGFYALSDVDLSIACCRAYNDWLADVLLRRARSAEGHPGAPAAVGARRARRGAPRASTELGFVSITMPAPCSDAQPRRRRARPDLYALAEELDVPLGFHAGGPRFCYSASSTRTRCSTRSSSRSIHVRAPPTIVCGGVLERFPRLPRAASRSRRGWGPYLFERLDEHYEKRADEMPHISKPPSEFLADGRLVVSCEGERHLPHALRGLGSQIVVYASDYPHWDAEFPDTVRHIADRDDLTEAEKAACSPRTRRGCVAHGGVTARTRSSSTCRSVSRRSR